ncbi:MAG TPA: hypothetical protein VIP46_06860 [Pyrinomonadaceae bacterium]
MVVWESFGPRPEPAETLDPKGEYLTRARQSSVCPPAGRLG